MSLYSKVVWSEGLFLIPQLFQQQERYLEFYAHKRAAPAGPFFWGFSRYEIDHEALSFGKIALQRGLGVFPDGTPFDIPGHNPPPAPLTVLPEHLNQIIYLAVPLRLPDVDETGFDVDQGSMARYQAFDQELADSNAIGQGPKAVQVAHLRLRLMSEKELTQSWIGVALGRVKAILSDGSVTLYDGEFIPPVSACAANPLLVQWSQQLQGLVKLRADALSSRLSSGQGGVASAAEVSDYLLLQILNRYDPLLDHICRVSETAPERLYMTLAMLAGDLATYVRPQSRRPLPAPGYDHAQLYRSIQPLVAEVHSLLNQVLVRSAQAIPLVEQAHGVRTATLMPSELQGYANLVLAVSAQMSPDSLMQQFISHTKISHPQRLPELIRSHLPGVTLSPLPVPPRQIPFAAGNVYFELSRSGPLWDQIARQGGLALHIAGHFPELKLELWGVRSR